MDDEASEPEAPAVRAAVPHVLPVPVVPVVPMVFAIVPPVAVPAEVAVVGSNQLRSSAQNQVSTSFII